MQLRSALLLAVLSAGAVFGQGTVIPTNTWVAPAPTAVYGFNNVGYQRTVYDPVRKLHVSAGAFQTKGNISSEYNNGWFGYSVAENKIIPIAAFGIAPSAHWGEAGHVNSVAAYVPSLSAIVGYQGDGSGSQTPYNRWGHFYALDMAGLAGRDIETTQRPWLSAQTPGYAASYNAANAKMLIYPGFQPGTARTVYWDPTTNTYTYFTDVSPGTIDNLTLEENPTNSDQTFLFGGAINNIRIWTWSTHTWSTPTTTCTGADCTGTFPPARKAAGFACSTTQNVCLMAGGVSAFGVTAYTDTWKYTPTSATTGTWTELSPSGSYANDPTNTNWDQLRYDADSDVFVFMMFDGTPRIYALAGSTPLNYGRTSSSYTPTSGLLNRAGSNASWVYEPTIHASGSNLYLGWQESGPNGATSQCSTPHTYVQSTPNTGTFTNLPTGTMASACSAIDSENGSNTIGGKTRLAVVNGTLWEASERFGPGFALAGYAKSWNGSTWSGGAIGCFGGTCVSGGSYSQVLWGLIAAGTTPTAIVHEYQFSNLRSSIYVAQFGGSSWSALSGAALNINTTGSRAVSSAIASDGTNVAVCWSEEVVDATDPMNGSTTTPQIQCKESSGSTFTRWGSTSLNISTSSFASDPAMTYVGGKYYVSWVERTTAGVAKVYLCRWDTTACTQLGGGALNINSSTGWAAHPSLTNDGTNVYLAWEEQSDWGQHSLAYVKQWNGTSVSQLGSAIAADTSNGSVEGVTLVASSTVRPTAIWGEIKYGTQRQAYAQQWTGSTWAAIGSTPPATTPTAARNGRVKTSGGVKIK